jgi:transcriptional regulator with XRE-family HTH domain
MSKIKSNNMSSLESLLEEITPEEQHRTDVRMQLAATIADAMEEKGWNKRQLMEAMGKRNPSEVTRWLSGTHNFTVDTLTDLGRVLNRNFINISNPEIQQLKKFKISTFTFSGSNVFSPPSSKDPTDSYSTQQQEELVLYNIVCDESR